ncbi:MAG: ABC transporter substrate-binding protein [Candidatus Cloacimonetes bacterium]|nr:ABC transporter substrate-binding protein [Candidatus Cloacimonadota bacterium]
MKKFSILNVYQILVVIIIATIFSSCKQESSSMPEVIYPGLNKSNDSLKAFVIKFRPQWYHQAQFAGVYVAAKKGFYKDYGIEVEIQAGGPDFPAYESIESGITDITQLFLLTALIRDSERNNLVNLLQLSQKSSLMLVAKKSRGINNISDMQHKNIGLWRTDFRELSLIFLEQNKLNMNLINVDWTINLFLHDVVEVINVMRYNEYHQILQAGVDPDDLFIVPFSEVGLNIVEDGLYTTREFYEQHTKECINFAEATMDGWLYAINHQEETLDLVLNIMQRHHIRANRPHQAWMLKEMREVILARPKGIGKLPEADFEYAKKLLENQNINASKQAYKDFMPNAH